MKLQRTYNFPDGSFLKWKEKAPSICFLIPTKNRIIPLKVEASEIIHQPFVGPCAGRTNEQRRQLTILRNTALRIFACNTRDQYPSTASDLSHP